MNDQGQLGIGDEFESEIDIDTNADEWCVNDKVRIYGFVVILCGVVMKLLGFNLMYVELVYNPENRNPI